MKSTGIVRRVDQLGRIVLPKELRDTFGINEGTLLEIHVSGEDIILRKSEKCCVFCGAEHDVFDFYNRPLCEKCARQITAGLKEEV